MSLVACLQVSDYLPSLLQLIEFADEALCKLDGHVASVVSIENDGAFQIKDEES